MRRVLRDHLPEVVERRQNGETLQQIGDRFGVTRERVRQVLKEEGVPPARTFYPYRRLARAVAVAAELESHLASGGVLTLTGKTAAPHGSTTRYLAGCSCDQCRAAGTARTRSLRGTPPTTHGASGYTNYGCRCDVCREGRRLRVDREKARARSRLHKALRRGRILRQPCEVCGEKGTAHHEDYSKPLDVRWLCAKHHGEEHQRADSLRQRRAARFVSRAVAA